jgi:hypothetical protein
VLLLTKTTILNMNYLDKKLQNLFVNLEKKGTRQQQQHTVEDTTMDNKTGDSLKLNSVITAEVLYNLLLLFFKF